MMADTMDNPEMKVHHLLYPDTTITMALFRNLESCKELRQCIMSGSLEASLLKTKMIIDPFQVMVAANKAVHLSKTNSMTTKNVHSEVLFCLSPTRNISESFRSLGAADGDESVFVVLIKDEDDARLNKICYLLGTTPSPLTQVSELADENAITKLYNLTEDELSLVPMVEAVVSRIAAKEVITTSKGKQAGKK